MKVFENQFLSVVLDQENNVLKAIWTPKTKNMTDEDFKHAIENGVWKNIATYKPKGFIGETHQFLYVIAPQIQEWYAQNISTVFGTHTKKVAMIMSADFITQLSVEQTIEEDQKSGFITQYFVDEATALQWIRTD